MDDALILTLLFERSEEGLLALAEKYGAYCGRIARNVLGDGPDAEECVNDTWLSVWNRIPPEEPRSLPAFCGKIARRRAIDRLRQRQSIKRGGGQYASALEELAGIAGSGGPAEALEAKELGKAINVWLVTLSPELRRAFLLRYWQCCSLEQTAAALGCGTGRVKSMLWRARNSLREHLKKEGYMNE